MTNPDLLREKHNEYYKEQEDVRLAEISVEEAKKLEAVEAAKSARLERALKQVKFIEDNEFTMGEESKGVRPYLTEMLEPVLTEGLLKVTNVIPNDPIDFLAEYIHWRSFEF